MGNLLNVFKKGDFEIIVKTGDLKRAGTNANVFCVLIDEEGKRSQQIKLDCTWRDDFEKGSKDDFKVHDEPNLGKIEKIELWRDSSGVADAWYVEYITVRKIKKGEEESEPTFFPWNRWVKGEEKQTLVKYDFLLPQFDDRKEQRRNELKEKNESYKFGDPVEGQPRRVAKLPWDENFSREYKFDIALRKTKLLAEKKLQELFTSSKFDSLADLHSVYIGSFGVPSGFNNWKSDENFGSQRLRGCSPNNIRLCEEIPENFAVTDEMVKTQLDGITLKEAIDKKILYIEDLAILENVDCKDPNAVLCAPLALFYEKDGELLPLAIQLNQKPADDNPVFTPNDPQYKWMLAKMFFNNSECALHQACTHLGFTHLFCEAVCVTFHLTLSPSHPVFRLLAPHCLYLIAINSLAVEKLLSDEGWIDTTMTTGVVGLLQILGRKWKNWRFDVDGWLPNELKSRNVDDTSRLKGYIYRDDSMLLHNAIVDYVRDVLKNVYDTPEKLKDDYEVQNFAALLVDDIHGPGIKGVFGGGKFEDLEDLVKVVAGTIFTGSVAHAAANFGQYDEYAFPANYPAFLRGKPPTDKTEITEEDILAFLPSKEMTLSIMSVTKILSERATNGLGDFEVQYIYEPQAAEAVRRFRVKLEEISKTISERNSKLKEPYPYLDPHEVPNAISI